MKNYLKIENKLCYINNALTNHIKQSKIQYKMNIEKNRVIFTILPNDLISLISLLKPFVKTGYHYIILSSQKTIRVSKQLYSWLEVNFQEKKNIEAKSPTQSALISNDKRLSVKKLGQYYTTNADYVLQGLSIPEGADIVEPFAGNGDLVNWSLETNPKSIECFDLQPQKCWIKKQDTLLTPPCYDNKYIVTNPPFLSKANSSCKILFNLYKTNNLYKCLIINLLESNSAGGILILPANFWFSAENLTLRKRFLAKYNVKRINIFEEQVFDLARITVCSFCFLVREDFKQRTNFFIFPRKEHVSTNILTGNIVELPRCFIANNLAKVARSTSLKGKTLYSTSLVLQTIDSSKRKKIGMGMVNNTDELGLEQTRISTSVCLDFDEQLVVMNEFNKILRTLRRKYSSLLFPYFLSCAYSGFDRKKIPINIAFNIISYIINTKNDDKNKS